MFLMQKVSLLLGSDSQGLKNRFRRADQLPPDVTARFSASTAGSLVLPADTSAVSVPLGGVATFGGVYLEVDQVTRVTIDPSAEAAITLTPAEDGQVARMLLNGAVALLQLSSATSGQTVNVEYAVWGD